MIINVRGTSGSGKSTLIRKVMDCYDVREPEYMPGRMRPIGYTCMLEGAGATTLRVLGHYESPCGGVDTLNRHPQQPKKNVFDWADELVRERIREGHHVLFEGLLLTAETKRLIELARIERVLVIGLNTSLDDCLESIMERRRAKHGAAAKPINPKHTESKYKATASTMKKLAAEGVETRWANRAEALELIRELLNLNASAS